MIEERLHGVFHDVLGVDHALLSDSTTAADIDGWDSLAHVTLMFSIEQEFGIQFAGEEFATLGNVGDLRTTIENKISRS